LGWDKLSITVFYIKKFGLGWASVAIATPSLTQNRPPEELHATFARPK